MKIILKQIFICAGPKRKNSQKFQKENQNLVAFGRMKKLGELENIFRQFCLYYLRFI